MKMSDSDSSDGNLLPRAFPVAKPEGKIDLSVPPSSAEEYLQQVVAEAQKCKKVITIELDKSKVKRRGCMINRDAIAKAPKGFEPSKTCQEEILWDFSKLQKKIEHIRQTKSIPKPSVKLPGTNQSEKWCTFCFGNAFHTGLLRRSPRACSQPVQIDGHQPLLSILLNIKQVTLENLIDWHDEWLDACGFSEEQGRWLYALLACLEKPLDPTVCSTLRHIGRLCRSERAKLDTLEHSYLPQLNALICIIGRYFDQYDLADTDC